MATPAQKKETPVSMRLRNDDLAIIDRGAELLGLSRTEFMRRAAVHEAQTAILNETVIRLSPGTFDDFLQAIGTTPAVPPTKVKERLQRRAPWKQ